MIIVTLSVVCTLKGMSRWLIQRIKAMLLCIEYGILFVDTVDTKIKACNALNAIYVNTVNTKHIHTFLPITFLIFNGFLIHKKFWKAKTQVFSTIPSILSMSTLSIQFSHLIILCIKCCVRATNTSVNSVKKHSIQCIACFDLHIDSVDKQDTLLNTQ